MKTQQKVLPTNTTRKKALVLWGERGSDKTTFAKNVAKADGTFAEFDYRRHQNSACNFMYSGITDEATFIFENIPQNAWGEIKQLVTQQMLTINEQMKPPRHTPMPKLIFICDQKPPISKNDRLFKLIEIRELEPLPYWYEHLVNKVLELRNTREFTRVSPRFEKISGYLEGLFMADVINNDAYQALSDVNRDVFSLAFQESSTETEKNYAPI